MSRVEGEGFTMKFGRSRSPKEHRNSERVGQVPWPSHGGDRAAGPLTLACLLLVAALLAGPTAVAPTVDPGVTFQPSDSWANISFATRQTFTTSIVVDATGVTFDGVRFGVEKSPRSLPRVEIVIDTWTPLQQVLNQTSVSFTGDAPSGTSVIFNLTNVLRNREYIFEVDAIERDRATTGSTGHVSFQWSAWSLHSFRIILGQSIGGPPPVGNVTAAFDYSLNGWSATFFDQSVTEGNTTITSRVWTFGDGSTSTEIQPTHAYPFPWLWSTYHASLAVCNNAGDCDATSKDITFINWFVIIALGVIGTAFVFFLWFRRRRRRKEEDEEPTERAEAPPEEKEEPADERREEDEDSGRDERDLDDDLDLRTVAAPPSRLEPLESAA